LTIVSGGLEACFPEHWKERSLIPELPGGRAEVLFFSRGASTVGRHQLFNFSSASHREIAITGRIAMLYRSSIWAVSIALAAVLLMATGGAQASDSAKYPDWKGAWERWVPPVSIVSPSDLRTPGGQPGFDQTKPWGRGEEAPLIPEYQKVLEDSIADQARGGQGNNFDRARCLPTGMPHMMTFGPLEFTVTPETTYILIENPRDYRRIFTDGRDWPKWIEPTYVGYSMQMDRRGRPRRL
jgi:hypothetical protein